MHIFKQKDTNFFQSGSLLTCIKLNVLSSLVCRKASLKVISFEKLCKSLLCSLVVLSTKRYTSETPCKICGVGIESGSQPYRTHCSTIGTATDKYIDVLNMIRNQPKVIFPPELKGLVCTYEPPTDTLSICR